MNHPQPVDPKHSPVVDSATQTVAVHHAVWKSIRNRLIEGLIVVLPIVLTFWIVRWVYAVLTTYIIGPLAALVNQNAARWNRSGELPGWFENVAAPLIAVLLTLALLYFCGVFAHSHLRRFVEGALLRVPIISPIYDSVRNVFQCFNQREEGAAPQRVVLVPFPHPGMRLPAIVTSTCIDVHTRKKLLCVYVPTTPVPTSGFFLMIPEEEATELNWDVQQTLQAIISGGLTAPPEVSYYSQPAGALASESAPQS